MVYTLTILVWFNSLIFFSGAVTVSATKNFPEFCFFAFIGLIMPRALMLTMPAVFGRTFFAYSIIQVVMLIIGAGLSAYTYRLPIISIIPSFFPMLTAIYYFDGSSYMIDKISVPVVMVIAIGTIVLLSVQAFREVRKTIEAGRAALASSRLSPETISDKPVTE